MGKISRVFAKSRQGGALLIDGNSQAAMSAFIAGKIRFDGDMSRLRAMQGSGPSAKPRSWPPASGRSRGSGDPQLGHLGWSSATVQRSTGIATGLTVQNVCGGIRKSENRHHGSVGTTTARPSSRPASMAR
jgi:hypothetical protein